ncbi:MAG: class I SAM-dependent methyltransferase [Thermotogota bacterium]
MTENMEQFFDNRVDSYDEYMKKNVDDYNNYYSKFGEYLYKSLEKKEIKILNLGAGTGIELKVLLEYFPEAEITALDISEKMLKKLKRKFKSYKISTIKDSYLNLDKYGDKFDCIISSMTMHHYFGNKKAKIFQSIHKSLNPNGLYIEGDYFSKTEEEQDFLIKEFLDKKISEVEGHFDIPLTIENEIDLLKKSGFKSVDMIYEKNKKNHIIVARK